MPSCLGLYIENNIIKYAKVSKEHEVFKVESFGIKFYDNIDDAVKQIVNETYSYKNPISTNLSDEKYTNAQLFSLLKQKDLNKAVKTEFEYFCNENKKNYNALEYRNLLIPSIEDKDKVTSLYAYTEKADIIGKNQMLSGFKVSNISPLPISIANLLDKTNQKNKVIVNIEEKTSVTFMINEKIHKIEIIDVGMKDVFDNIIMKENSYAKAYEICKNTTIYTMQGKNLQIEENEYMEDIMPVLYNIIEKLKNIIYTTEIKIDEIYITGLASAINNIDLYFQENFIDKKCEILAPFFVEKSNIKLNIRDYIEVNSAIALALQGLGVGYKEINFKHKGALEQINQVLNKEIGGSSNNNKSNSNLASKFKDLFKMDFNKSLDVIEINMIRFAVGILALIIVYIVFSNIILKQINKKEEEIQAFIKNTKEEIAEISNNKIIINERTEQYNTMIDKINEANNKLIESYARRNVLPNFLTEIMFNIPKEVQLLAITNTSGKTIRIEAQSEEYEQLGYFIAKIRNEGILTDVTSTSGEKREGYIIVTIEGKLPY